MVALPELLLNLQPGQGLSWHGGMSHIKMSPVGVLDPTISVSDVVDLCSRERSGHSEYVEVGGNLIDELSEISD